MNCQMPDCCQSRRRLQQVMPEPQPSSFGSISQGMPLRRTNTMPLRHTRSAIRGRPPCGLGLGNGKRGSITSRKMSGTGAAAIAGPPRRVEFSSHAVVAVEIRGVVDSFAVSVVGQQRKTVCEALLNFQDATVINGVCQGSVFIVLQNGARWVSKAERGIGHTLQRFPVLERESVGGKAVRAWCRTYDRRAGQQVLVNGPRQMRGMDVDVARSDR